MPLPEQIAGQVSAQALSILQRGSQAKFNKIRQRTLYSTWLFAPGLAGVIPAGKYELFKALRGDTGQGYEKPLTDRETNWLSAGRVPDDQNLIVQAIGVDIRRAPSDSAAYSAAQLAAVNRHVPPHATDVAALAYGATLNLQSLTSTVAQGLLADFPAVGGVFGFHEGSRPRSIDKTDAGDPGPPAITIHTPTAGSPAGTRGHLPVSRQGVAAAFERRLTIAQLLAAKDTFSMSIILPSAITLLGQNDDNEPTQDDATGCIEVQVQLFCTESVRNQG